MSVELGWMNCFNFGNCSQLSMREVASGGREDYIKLMPIQRRPPGSGKNGNSSDEEKLTPLQRYIARQKEAEANSKSNSKQGTAELGAKASRLKSKVQSKVQSKLDHDARPEAKKPADRAAATAAASAESPMVPPPEKPPTEPPISEPPRSQEESGSVPGPFLARFAAYLVDLAILGAAAKGIDRFFFGPLRWMGGADIFGFEDSLYFILYHALAFFYFGWFYSTKGASPGKIILQLEVRDAHSNQRLGYWRAFLRESIGKYVSTVPLLLGFLLAGLRRDHRALHDLIFDTKVERRRA